MLDAPYFWASFYSLTATGGADFSLRDLANEWANRISMNNKAGVYFVVCFCLIIGLAIGGSVWVGNLWGQVADHQRTIGELNQRLSAAELSLVDQSQATLLTIRNAFVLGNVEEKVDLQMSILASGLSAKYTPVQDLKNTMDVVPGNSKTGKILNTLLVQQR